MDKDVAKKISLNCWAQLKSKLWREYSQMQDEGGQAGTLKMQRTAVELDKVQKIFYRKAGAFAA